MKSPLSLACCTVGLLCFTLSAPLAVANPLKSIGSSLKKAGNALNPFKKGEAKPAAAAPVPAPAAKAKTKAQPTAAKSTKPAPAKKKKPAAASSAKSKPAAEVSKTAAAAGTTAAAATAGANGTDEKVDSTETPPETAPGAAPPDTPETPPAPPAAAPVPLAELPFGIPVMGRKGYVRSPYAEDQGMVDVNDIPAGAKVKCPFTGKVFRVP